jgi:hypothetical protein
VSHDILLNVLQSKFGVSDASLAWFDTYLRPRSARVKIDDSHSKPASLDYSVPQGSICGPVLYTVYASTLQEHILDYDTQLLGYADDHSIYDDFNPNCTISEQSAIENLEKCLVSVNQWMHLNRLKMNNDKTEFLLLGSKYQLQKCTTDSIKVCDYSIQRSTSLKYLGMHLDSQLNLKIHIREKCRVAAMNLHSIRQIRNILTPEACHLLVQCLVVPHLDYANALFEGLPSTTLAPLQLIQNMAAKLILNKRKYDSATESLKHLHWLPVKYRSKFKVACLVFLALNGDGPSYLRDLLSVRQVNRSLRSNSEGNGILLTIPKTTRKTFAERSFSVNGPKIWNSLPSNLRLITDFTLFKKNLKTFYFKIAYDV